MAMRFLVGTLFVYTRIGKDVFSNEKVFSLLKRVEEETASKA